jgi:hypothetical protein
MDEFAILDFYLQGFSSVETRTIPKAKETGSKVPSISHKKAHSSYIEWKHFLSTEFGEYSNLDLMMVCFYGIHPSIF